MSSVSWVFSVLSIPDKSINHALEEEGGGGRQLGLAVPDVRVIRIQISTKWSRLPITK